MYISVDITIEFHYSSGSGLRIVLRFPGLHTSIQLDLCYQVFINVSANIIIEFLYSSSSGPCFSELLVLPDACLAFSIKLCLRYAAVKTLNKISNYKINILVNSFNYC